MTIQYTMHDNTIQYNTIQYNTISTSYLKPTINYESESEDNILSEILMLQRQKQWHNEFSSFELANVSFLAFLRCTFLKFGRRVPKNNTLPNKNKA